MKIKIDKETYEVLEILKKARDKVNKVYESAGIEDSINTLDMMIIEENLNRLDSSIEEIKRYSKGKLRSFSTTSTLRVLPNCQFELLDTTSQIYDTNRRQL